MLSCCVKGDIRHAKYQLGSIYHSRPNKDNAFLPASTIKPGKATYYQSPMTGILR